MTTKWPKKDPDERLDYSLDWTVDESGNANAGRLLDGDTIFASVWIPPVGITIDTESFSDTVTTVWLIGGIVGETYDFLNRVTTAGGRIMDKTVRLKIKEK